MSDMLPVAAVPAVVRRPGASRMRRIWNLFTLFMRSMKLFNWKNEISLTNVAFYIVLYKIALTDMSGMSVAEMATALSVLGLYFGKKVLNKSSVTTNVTEDPGENNPEEDEDPIP